MITYFIRIWLQLALVSVLMVSQASAQTARLEFTTTAYPPYLKSFNKHIADFSAVRTDITVTIQASQREFRTLTQQTLRSAIVGDLPDFSITGTN